MIKQFILATVLLTLISGTAQTQQGRDQLQVNELMTEYLKNPMGIDQLAPRFYWVLETQRPNTLQTHYQIQVATQNNFSRRSMVWDTDRYPSAQSIHVAYDGNELESTTRYFWRVRIWDNHGRQSAWSETAWFETGLLNQDEWIGEWIGVPWNEDKTISQPAPILRKEFATRGRVQSARLYATSLGLYEVEINGRRVGDQLFTPGWNAYSERLQYQTYDVTSMLNSGNNAMGVMLGDGWYRGYIGWGSQRNYYGEDLAFSSMLVIQYSNGSTETIITDQSWKATTGPIRKSDIYNGETYDARMEMKGWSQPGFDEANWQPVKIMPDPGIELITPQAPPIKKIQELPPIAIFTTPKGDTVIDFGQNLVGHVKLTHTGNPDTKVMIRHAETLDKDGNFYTENLRSADQINTYIAKGNGTEVWEPRFTFQGFRYIAVSGYPGNIDTEGAFTAVAIHSDMEPTGHFDCSNPLINQLQHNIVWGQKGNFLDVPTDCPQRDERLGWTGDIQVFAPTANSNMFTAGFLTRWLADLQADQLDNGAVPHVIPNVLGENSVGAAGWADASVFVPWSLYQAYGDIRILDEQYESMQKWISYMGTRAARFGDPHVWSGDFHFGDWLAYATINRSDYQGAYTHTDLIATAFFAGSTSIMLQAAKILDKPEDVNYYTILLDRIVTAFRKEFITPNGRLSSDTQTAYLLALNFDLIPEDLRANSAQYFVNEVRRHGHLTTGFLGTPHLNPTLSELGYQKEAYQLMQRTQYPSWLYPVTMGATTIWERWDGIKPDSTFQNAGMNSFNHYAYGAIGFWLYENVAGIKAAEPGYKSIRISPNPGGGLTHARATRKTLYGTIRSAWKIEDGQFHLETTIPANTTATIVLPFARSEMIRSDNALLADALPNAIVEEKDETVSIEVGSGNYSFSYSAENFPAYYWEAETHIANEFKPFSLETKTAVLLADDEGRRIMEEALPGLYHSMWLSQIMNFSLRQGLQTLPQGIVPANTDLKQINNRLKGID